MSMSAAGEHSVIFLPPREQNMARHLFAMPRSAPHTGFPLDKG